MDISVFIASVVLQYPWGGSAVVVLSIFGYFLTQVFPKLPIPAPGQKGVWPWVYVVLSFLAGNWGNARNGPVAVTTAGVIVPLLKQDSPHQVPTAPEGETAASLAATPMVNRPPSYILPWIAIPFGLLLITVAACSSPPDLRQTLAMSESAYTTIALTEVDLIRTGAVSPAIAKSMRDVDTTAYAALVAFREAVEKGKGSPAALGKALFDSLTDLSTKVSNWAKLKPETQVAVNAALSLLRAYVAATGG